MKKEKGKEKKKEKLISVKSDITTIYVPHIEKEDAKTHQIIRSKLDFNHHRQPHTPLEGCRRMPGMHQQLFFMCTKQKI